MRLQPVPAIRQPTSHLNFVLESGRLQGALLGFDKQNPSGVLRLIQQRVGIGQATGTTVQQHHAMDITVMSGGEIKVQVHYKDKVPDLLSRFPLAVQQRARRWLYWPSRYERKVWKATKGMPRWARETVRQHLLHERAEEIHSRLQRTAARKEARERSKQAKMTATRSIAKPELKPELPRELPREQPPPSPPKRGPYDLGPPLPPHEPEPLMAVDVPPQLAVVQEIPRSPAVTLSPVGGNRQAAGSALGAPVRGALTLTERLAQQHGIAPAQPRPLDRGRGR